MNTRRRRDFSPFSFYNYVAAVSCCRRRQKRAPGKRNACHRVLVCFFARTCAALTPGAETAVSSRAGLCRRSRCIRAEYKSVILKCMCCHGCQALRASTAVLGIGLGEHRTHSVLQNILSNCNNFCLNEWDLLSGGLLGNEIARTHARNLSSILTSFCSNAVMSLFSP